jgi:hypothetical protein
MIVLMEKEKVPNPPVFPLESLNNPGTPWFRLKGFRIFENKIKDNFIL